MTTLQRMERGVRLAVGWPLALLLYGLWLVAVGLARLGRHGWARLRGPGPARPH